MDDSGLKARVHIAKRCGRCREDGTSRYAVVHQQEAGSRLRVRRLFSVFSAAVVSSLTSDVAIILVYAAAVAP